MFYWLHTKSATYKLVVFAVFGLECIFGWRTGAMYQDALSEVITNPYEVWALTILFSVAVAVFGFALATHRQYGIEAITERIKKHLPTDAKAQKRTVSGEKWSLRLAMAFFIAQDIAGVIYSFFGHGLEPTFPLIAATISMSGFTIVPFFIGHMTLALAEAIPTEKREQFYANLYELWQDALITAAGKWAKKARQAPPEEILAPVIKSLISTSPDGMHSDAIKGLFRMDGDDKLVPFRPKQASASSSNGTGEDDEE